VHATVIDNILAGDFAARPRWYRAIDLLVIIVLGALTGAALPRMSALGGFVFAASLVAVYMLAAYGPVRDRPAVAQHGVPPDDGGDVLHGADRGSLSTEERAQGIKETFKRYVSADVIEDVLADRAPETRWTGKVPLGDVQRPQGFTSYSEKYPASEIIGILSDYYDRMTEQVFAHRGTLTNYNGDALMAIFGAPVEQADHAHRACAAALAMLAHRDALGAEWAKLGRPHLRARTGINTGPMLVGNVGSRYRFAYGARRRRESGLAARAALNRVYGTQIMIGEHTARQVAAAFLPLRQIDGCGSRADSRRWTSYELIATLGTDS
jgi:adenylate cyclase